MVHYVSTPALFIKDAYYYNLQYLINVIMTKTKVVITMVHVTLANLRYPVQVFDFLATEDFSIIWLFKLST